jgi:hypothetical protein
MCTVSWLRRPGGYELFCNRDERHSRKPGAPPALQGARGMRFVAPTDGDHGGSWIGVNEAGLALCLLNGYEGAPTASAAEGDYRSRGLLLTGLIDCATVSQVRERVLGADLSCYRPLTMAVLTPDEPALLVRWAGGRKSFDAAGDAAMPLTSSSYRGDEVSAARRSLFRRMVDESGAVTPEFLREFHRSHEPERGAFSVCMHRGDAATVSFSHVKVDGRLIEFSYQPLSPCERSRPVRVALPLGGEALPAR